MKNKLMIGTAIFAVILACALGGWAITSKPAPTPTPIPTPVVTPTSPPELPAFNATVPTPSATQTPKPTESTAPATPSASVTPGQGQTIITDEGGNQTITPNWSTDKLPDNANVVPRQPDANVSGGGGSKLPTDKDGIYRGDQVAPSPTPSPTPSATTPSAQPSTEPSQAPATSAPSDNGSHKNGEISPDGSQVWFEGFGWVDRDSDGGGQGGNDYDPDAKLSGNKVGDM